MFMMFQKTGGPGIESGAFSGYITVYQYYAYGPETNRNGISTKRLRPK